MVSLGLLRAVRCSLPESTDRPSISFLHISSSWSHFQLQDDLLDLYGDKGRSGIGEDLREGKLSFLIVKHVELHPTAKQSCLEFLRSPREEVSAEEVAAWISKFREDGTLAAALDEFKRREMDLLSAVGDELPHYQNIFKELASVIKAPIQHLFA